MSFKEYKLSSKISEAISAIQLASKMSEDFYGEPITVAYSGGKDSDVLLHLCLSSNVRFKVSHSLTTVDAPQTVHHVKQAFSKLKSDGIDCQISNPTYKENRISMWELIPMKLLPPTRLMRYCCDVLKEHSTPNMFILTGIRGGESLKRKQRKMFEIRGSKIDSKISHNFQHVDEVYSDSKKYPEVYDCKYISKLKQKADAICNPIINWTDLDIWQYIRWYNVPYCELYDMGYKRCGCVGCPMASVKQRLKEFRDFPKYELNYKKAFERMLQARKSKQLETKWKSADEVFDWWVGQ